LEGAGKKAIAEALRSFSTPQWWLIGAGLEGKAEEPTKRVKRGKPEAFQKQCAERHAEMVKLYESAMMQDSEQRWLRKVCSDGTLGDKVASLTMLIQVCPVLSTGYIKSLLSLASKMGKSDAAMAVDALKDLFVGTLLPDRKLKTFAQMEPVTEKHLGKVAFTERCVVAFFEDYLKTAFAAFVQVLGEAAHSAVVFLKTKAIRTVQALLAAKPEQERVLLGIIVNKFGDLASKVSSLVSQCLRKLEEAHPGMRRVIVKEVEVFLTRPKITSKSQYYALLHLTEIVLSRREEDVRLAEDLIKLYIRRLEDALRPPEKPAKKARHKFGRKRQARIRKRRGNLVEDDNRLIRTLINGIQRALPYLEAGIVTGSVLETETVDALFKVCHTVSAYSTRIAILSLLFRCLSNKGDVPDRFHRLLYDQVLQFDFWGCSHKMKAYLLVRNCVPADTSLLRGVALVRRLLQVGANSEPAVAAAGLSIVRELLRAHRAEMKQLLGTSDCEVKAPAAVEDDAEEVFVDDDAVGAASDAATGGGQRERYTPLAREPRFARSRNTPIWELHAMARHVHPFVAYGATRLLAHESFDDAGSNPFEEFSCNELLEQFAYVARTRKLKTGKAGGAAGKDASASRVLFNSEKFVKKTSVQPHEKFFQMYFRDSTVRQQQLRKAKLRKQRPDDVDEEAIDGGPDVQEPDEEDKFFDDYLQGQLPAGDEDDDGPDIDDDSDEGSDGDEGSDIEGDDDEGSDDDGSGPGADDQDDEAASSSEAEEERPAKGGRKRKAPEAELSQADRAKALRKKHSGAMFASVEDFEQLLAEDAA